MRSRMHRLTGGRPWRRPRQTCVGDGFLAWSERRKVARKLWEIGVFDAVAQELAFLPQEAEASLVELGEVQVHSGEAGEFNIVVGHHTVRTGGIEQGSASDTGADFGLLGGGRGGVGTDPGDMQFENVTGRSGPRVQIGDLGGEPVVDGAVGDAAEEVFEIVDLGSVPQLLSDTAGEFTDSGLPVGGIAIGVDPVGMSIAGSEQEGTLRIAAGPQVGKDFELGLI